MLGACWITPPNGLPYCAYPVNSQDRPTLRPSQTARSTSRRIKFGYGQPVCLPFSDTATGANFLSSYDRCLKAGCFTTVSRNDVWQQLISLGNAANLDNTYKFIYQAMVYRNLVRPDNYQQVLDILANPRNPICLAQRFPGFNFQSALQTIPLLPNSFTFDTSGRTGGLGGNNLQQICASLFGGAAGGSAASNPLASLCSNPLSPITGPQFNPCPYQVQQYNLPGFPTLSGSFEGCCDQPRCFIPRLNFLNCYSGYTGYLSTWTAWGRCSRSCGGGTQTRSRQCINNYDAGCTSDTTMEMEQTNVCNGDPCPAYLNWSNWTLCTVTCGPGGNRTRYRQCNRPGFCGNLGEAQQIETDCAIGIICPIENYTEWSTCSSTCGSGTRSRIRTSCNPPNVECTSETITESCERYVGIQRAAGACNPATCCRTGVTCRRTQNDVSSTVRRRFRCYDIQAGCLRRATQDYPCPVPQPFRGFLQ